MLLRSMHDCFLKIKLKSPLGLQPAAAQPPGDECSTLALGKPNTSTPTSLAGLFAGGQPSSSSSSGSKSVSSTGKGNGEADSSAGFEDVGCNKKQKIDTAADAASDGKMFAHKFVLSGRATYWEGVTANTATNHVFVELAENADTVDAIMAVFEFLYKQRLPAYCTEEEIVGRDGLTSLSIIWRLIATLKVRSHDILCKLVF